MTARRCWVVAGVLFAVIRALPVIAATYYVRPGGSGTRDGLSWANAHDNLQAAIELCDSDDGGEVWVAAGIYKPDGWPNGGTEPYERHFSLRSGVAVMGGFPNEGAPGRSDRDPTRFPTVCSGDTGGTNEEERVQHIFYHDALAFVRETAVLDGVWIANARGLRASSGGGMLNDSASPTVRDCVFQDNYAGTSGGAVFCYRGHPRFERCNFVRNKVGRADRYVARGGAVCTVASDVELTQCRFVDNEALSACAQGGALNFGDGELVVTDCEFVGNKAGTRGEEETYGGSCEMFNASVVFSGCRFQDNEAANGGAIYTAFCEYVKTSDCDFIGNVARHKGGAMHTQDHSHLMLARCVFKNNTAATDYEGFGGALFVSGRHWVHSCVFEGNRVERGNQLEGHGGGVFAYVSFGHYVNCIFLDNEAAEDGGGLSVDGSTVSLVNCVLTRNSAERGGGLSAIGGRINCLNTIVRFNNAIGSWHDDVYPGDYGNRLSFSHCNVRYRNGGWDGTGNQAGPVAFVNRDDPDGADDTWLTLDDGLQLQAHSPCRDAGYSDAVEAFGPDMADLDGDGIRREPVPLDCVDRIRVHGENVDMGAYEYGAPEQPTFLVRFDLGTQGTRTGGGALLQRVRHHHAAVAPELDVAAGWEFAGWDHPFRYVSRDLTVTAQYRAVFTAHRVVFDTGEHGRRVAGGATFQLVSDGEPASAPLLDVDTGWYFVGWSEPFDHVTNNLTVDAWYQSVDFPGDVCHVKPGCIGHGASWVDAMGDLQAAIDAVHARGTGSVWVAAGTYRPTGWPNGGDDPRRRHFALRNNVAVYGGFPRSGNPGMKDCRPSLHLTVCSGDIGIEGDTRDNAYHVFYHPDYSFLDDSALLHGFTITGGRATGSESPDSQGAGMYTEASGPLLRRCVFRDNTACSGGGVFCRFFPPPAFRECTFATNSASSLGGGVRAYGCSPSFRECTFVGNEARCGGGMANESASPRLTRCVFERNAANSWGGALYNAGASPSLVNAVFAENTAAEGAAVYNTAFSAPFLANAIFTGNAAITGGGGMYNKGDASPTLTHCVLNGNSATQGGGIYNWNAAPSVINSILWGNQGGEFFNYGSRSTVHHSIIQGGFATGALVLDAVPLFVDALAPKGGDGKWLTDDDGLRVHGVSPAVNAGDDEYLPSDTNDLDEDDVRDEALPYDVRRDPRQVGAHVDMGAYEHHTPPAYTVEFVPGSHGTRIGGGELSQSVDVHGAAVEPELRIDFGWTLTGWDSSFDDVTNAIVVMAQYGPAFVAGDICYVREGEAGNGESWERAAGDLQEAIDMMHAVGGGQVWVAAGTYHPVSHPNGGSSGREAHFALRPGVTVLGGFPSAGSPGLDARDPWEHGTICSGEFGIPASSTDNVYHVFFHPDSAGLDGSAVLDGVTITDGVADGPPPHDRGAGMYNAASSPTLRNCLLINCVATWGGGMHNCRTSSPALTRCVFSGNSATNGGAMVNAATSTPTLVSCVFANNRGMLDGGGVLNDASDPLLANCIFIANEAERDGGGVCNVLSSPHLGLCTLRDNVAARGGGICNTTSSFPVVDNCIVWSNRAPTGASMCDAHSASSRVSHCIVENGWAGGDGILDTAPLCVDASDPDGPDDRWFTPDDGLRPLSASPGTDSGDTAALPTDVNDLDGDGNTGEPLPADGLGGPRVAGRAADMGCYEIVPTHAGLSPVHYVSLAGSNIWPYASWADAATCLQFAVDAAASNDVVMVTNGTYSVGGAVAPGRRLMNRVCVTKSITVTSVNGPARTSIVGAADALSTNGLGPRAIRCAYLSGNARLGGFTLSGGYTACLDHAHPNSLTGGGAFIEDHAAVSNCVLTDCRAVSGGGICVKGAGNTVRCLVADCTAVTDGGGVTCKAGGTLGNCLFIRNRAAANGGGACLSGGGVLQNCTLVGNAAAVAGSGVYCLEGGALTNCVVYLNSADGAGGDIDSVGALHSISHSCSPGLAGGTGNITNDPQFASVVAEDVHLAPASPCVDAGMPGMAVDTLDIDGRSRVMGASVDMGCYERVPVHGGASPVHFVSPAGGNVYPYSDWVSAAVTLQNAVDAAAPGETVLVTNGVYANGGAISPGGGLWNRICVVAPITIRSVNGANVTVIRGSPDPDAPQPGCGANATRCVYLAGNATLSGFTLTDGRTLSTTNAPDRRRRDDSGGGAWLIGASTLEQCRIVDNAAAYSGGGVFCHEGGAVQSCTIYSNAAATTGGGVGCFETGRVTSCRVYANSAGTDGGGAYLLGGGYLDNCLVALNSAAASGGGVHCGRGSALSNCTVAGNSALGTGGVRAFGGGDLMNCIVFGNAGRRDLLGTGSWSARSSCSPELSSGGTDGNISGDPQFADAAAGDYHPVPGSPCVNAGSNSPALPALDLDGRARILDGVVDMGCYELDTDFPPATPRHYVSTIGGGIPPYATWATAARSIQAAVDAAEPGDVVWVTNGVYASGGAVGTPVPPWYTPLALTNRVCVTNAVSVRSVNGAAYTHIAGQGPVGADAIRCVFLTGGASLGGFTLTNGHTRSSGNSDDEQGGGAYIFQAGHLSRCILSGNKAAQWGGGVYVYRGGTVSSSLFTDNEATQKGGGAGVQQGGTLLNCTLVANTAASLGGGGLYSANGAWVTNSIIHGNWAPSPWTNDIAGDPTVVNSCSPDVVHGSDGNITNNPHFVDAAIRDYRLRPGSPCADMGNSSSVVDARDLDGEDRILGPSVDMGSYEYRSMADHSMHYAQMPDASGGGWALGTGATEELIDDFESATGDALSMISFWGSWQGDVVGNATGIVLTVYADNAGRPATRLWRSMRVDFKFTEEGGAWNRGRYGRLSLLAGGEPTRCFRFDVCIPADQAFSPVVGTRYWLAMSVLTGSGTWYWRNSDAVPYGSDALWWDDEHGMWADIPDSPAPGELDLAFVVSGLQDEMPLDCGDAPDSGYGTLIANLGAHHTIVPGLYLGTGVDGEPDGQPDDNARGDDVDVDGNNPTPNFDDDDGVRIVGPLVAGQPAAIVLMAGPSGGRVDGWIDFGVDGSWWDPGDQVLRACAVSAGTNPPVSIQVPDYAVPGPTYARFRISSAGELGPAGPADDGEVEDYRVVVYQPAPSGVIAIVDMHVGDAGRQRRVLWNAQSNTVYQLQAASNLFPAPGWWDLGHRVRGAANGLLDGDGSATTRYYRVVAPYVLPSTPR